MNNLEFARYLIKQCAEYDELGREVGVTLSELHPDHGFIYLIAEQIEERINLAVQDYYTGE